MATTFRLATDEERKWLDYATRQYHPKLAEAGVRVGMLFAHDPDGPAVKSGGYPAAATVKVLPLKERVTKGYDAELLVDEDAWDTMTREQRVALCDHELSHLAVVDAKKEPGLFPDPSASWWKTDDIGRPKLRPVKANWNAGDGFLDVVARHGEHAQEYANIRQAKRLADQAAAQGEGVEIDPEALA